MTIARKMCNTASCTHTTVINEPYCAECTTLVVSGAGAPEFKPLPLNSEEKMMDAIIANQASLGLVVGTLKGEIVYNGEIAQDAVVEANRKLLLERSKVGIGKYGVTLQNSGLSKRQILQHALEEALDLANYLQTEIMRLDAEANKLAA